MRFYLCGQFANSSLSADNIVTELRAVVDDWSLSAKLEAVTTDNARNITRAVEQLGCKHLPCFGHTLQLRVKAGLQLPAVAQLIARYRRVVGHFRHSYNAQNALALKQIQLYHLV